MRGVAQLVARYVRDVEAAGSSPVTPTSPAEVQILNEGGLFISAGFGHPLEVHESRVAGRAIFSPLLHFTALAVKCPFLMIKRGSLISILLP